MKFVILCVISLIYVSSGFFQKSGSLIQPSLKSKFNGIKNFGRNNKNINEQHQPKLSVLHENVTDDNYEVNNLISSCNFQMYKQCDSEWGNDKLGTSSTTICSAGCAMSSVAMMLSHYNKTMNPGQLNTWLTDNNGYADNDLIVWASVDVFGPSFQGIEYGVSVTTLADGLNSCHGIIANVRSGSHWVLVTGYDDANTGTFYVNDPGFSDTSYALSGMSHFVAYTKTAFYDSSLPQASGVQEERAQLQGGMSYREN